MHRFGLRGSSAALAALRPCQLPQAQAAVPQAAPVRPAPLGLWRYEDHDGVIATASIRLPGERFLQFYCNPPDRARFVAWVRRDGDRNHVPFVEGRFDLSLGANLWPELAGRNLDPHTPAKRLALVVGARRLEGAVEYNEFDGAFFAPVLFDSPLLRVLAEGEQAGERLILQEGERVLAAVPLQGFAAAIDRARAFCGGGAAADAAPRPTPPPATPTASLATLDDPRLPLLPMLFNPVGTQGLHLFYGSQRVTHPAPGQVRYEPFRTAVEIVVYDLDGLARGAPPRAIDSYAADFVMTGNGFTARFPRVVRVPKLTGVCARHTVPEHPRAILQVETYREPAPGQAYVQASLPFAAWAETPDACAVAISQVVREQGLR